jgi:hypothetical protein
MSTSNNLISGGYVPIVISPNPPVAEPGTSVVWTVGLNKVAEGNQVVTVSCSPANAFTNFPPNMTVLNGQSSGTFSATVASGFVGGATATASIGTAFVSAPIAVPDEI